MSKKQTALEFLDSKKGKKLLKKNLNAAKKIVAELTRKEKVDPKTWQQKITI